jgi:hypothetical protein
MCTGSGTRWVEEYNFVPRLSPTSTYKKEEFYRKDEKMFVLKEAKYGLCSRAIPSLMKQSEACHL